jgi:2-iminobutanoate/2-iminopropanoate deaminase
MQRTVLGRSSSSYSQGLVVEGKRLIFISGQLPTDAEGKLVGAGDMEAQVRQTFANVQRLLNQAGASMDNVVKLTAFLTKLDDYAKYSAVRREFFAPNFPASSAVQVAGLVLDGALIEIEAVAVLD